MSKPRQLVVNSAGIITGYHCQLCNSYNDILRRHCHYCRTDRPADLNDIESKTIYKRGLTELSDITMAKETNEELHAKFFNAERVLVKDMDLIQLRAHREELASIAFEARARLTAVDAEENERRANLSAEDRQKLLSDTNPNPNISDAIAAVKRRSDRMSKADKLAAALAAMGLSDEDVAEYSNNIVKTATDKSINATVVSDSKYALNKVTKSELCRIERHSECTVNFNDGESRVCQCECHKVNVASEPVTKFINPFAKS